jgi:hypothetical protein
MLAERRQAEEATAAGPPPSRVFVLRQATTRWLQVNRLPAFIVGAALVAAVSVTWYLLVTRPRLEREKAAQDIRAAEQLESEITARQTALETCLATAETDYTAIWDASCKARKAPSGCALPTTVIEAQQRKRSDARNACLQQYSTVR